ncbi:MAG TPA: Fur family transcriptional regulator [Acidisarcina sp.]|nr:Fur family transcriptional regulator [Acidisarcina sp.]
MSRTSISNTFNSVSLASPVATQSQQVTQKGSSDLASAFRSRGLRLTEQRRVLLEILQEAQEHLDAAGLWEVASKRMQVDRATVYRTLELLKKEQLIDELDLMHLQGEKHYYEARTEREHLHLACFNCGKIEEVSSPLFDQLKQQVTQWSGFAIQTARLEIGGYCKACQDQGTTGPKKFNSRGLEVESL